MKNKLISTILLITMIVLDSFASTDDKGTKTIVTTQPGTLSGLCLPITYGIHTLIVEGPINSDDIAFLNQCTRTDGIKELNLQKANIESGKVPDDAFSTYVEGRLTYGITAKKRSTLSKITLPETVIEIGEFTFDSLPHLKEVVLPAGLKKIGMNAFTNCPSLESIAIPDGVEELPIECFKNCTELKNVKLPSSLKKIGAYCFENTGITELTLPDGLEKIGRGAFRSTKLAKISIPASCTAINKNAFEGNTMLSEINLPPTLIRIPYGMFSGCTALRNVVIPEGVVAIGKDSFRGCTSLSDIKMPSSLQTVENEAFYGFNAETLTLPENLKYIGMNAFYGTAVLKSLYSKNVYAPAFAKEAAGSSDGENLTGFNAESRNIPVYIPKGSYNNYNGVLNWSYFKNFIEIDNFPSN